MLKEISAEMLLGYLYPDSENSWKADYKGTFYRNYNNDCLSYNPEAGTLELARDGFLKILPDGVISNQDSPKGKEQEKSEEQKLKEILLAEAFSPFDSFAFRDSLKLEKNVSSMLTGKTELILKNFFDIDPDTITDPLVREAAMMLPMVYGRRGDPHFIKLMLEAILRCKVELDMSHRFSESESDKAWMPKAVYTLRMPGLTPEQFREKYESLKPLEEFIRDRLMPFDVAFEMIIRDNNDNSVPDNGRCLDYNLQIR